MTRRRDDLPNPLARSYGRGICVGCGIERGLLSNGKPWSHNLPNGETQPNGYRICPGCDHTAARRTDPT